MKTRTKTSRPKTTVSRRRVGKKLITTTTTVVEEVVAPPPPRNYVSIQLDSSGSMRSIASGAVKMYNETVRRLKTEALATGQETIVSLWIFGDYRTHMGVGGVYARYRNIPVTMVPELSAMDFRPDGGTPLFDCVGLAAIELQRLPDARDPNVSFLLITITDGEENESKRFRASEMQAIMRETQRTDRWTHTFLLPRGNKREFVNSFGIPEGNVAEWDQTEEGVRQSTVMTQQGVSSFYAARSAGQKSVQTFYTNPASLSTAAVRAALTDLSPQIKAWEVPKEVEIREFVESHLGLGRYTIGAGYYQLTKAEKIQAYKQLLIVEKGKRAIYGGDEARDLLGLPRGLAVKVIPGNHGKYDLFVQSTSVNRKLVRGTRLLYDTLQVQGQRPTWDHIGAGLRP